jgi:uncharacterized coiled-coil protein SlyX
MDQEGQITTRYSLTLSKLQAILTGLGVLITFLVALGSGMLWARVEMKATMKEVANEVINEKLKEIHEIMEPTLYKNMDKAITQKILEHTLTAEAPFDQRLGGIESRLTALEASLPALIKSIDRNTILIDRNNDKLDAILAKVSR